MVRDEKSGREEKGRSAHGLRKKATTLFSVIAVIALVVGSLFGDRGILQLLRQRQRTEVLAREIEQLRDENRVLAEEIAARRAAVTPPTSIPKAQGAARAHFAVDTTLEIAGRMRSLFG
jgi:hypothetical protein